MDLSAIHQKSGNCNNGRVPEERVHPSELLDTFITQGLVRMYYLHGGAGVPNFGDELIVRQWLDFLATKLKEPIFFPQFRAKQITVSGMRKKALNRLFSDRYPKVHYADALYKYQSKLPKGYWTSFQEGLNFFQGSGKISGPELSKIRAARVFHLHGGGYINKLWPNNAFYFGFAAALKKETGCRVVGTGLGLAPSPTPPTELRDSFAEALKAFDAIELRDKASFDFVQSASFGEANATLGLDDIFLTPPEVEPGPRTFHLSLHSNERTNDASSLLDLDFINSFERRIFWQCHYRDVDRYEELKQLIPDLIRRDVVSLTHDPLPIGPDDFMVTSRFHPHMQGARSGIRGQFVAPWEYSENKHGSVMTLGSKFSHFPNSNNEPSLEMRDNDLMRIQKKRAYWESEIGKYI